LKMRFPNVSVCRTTCKKVLKVLSFKFTYRACRVYLCLNKLRSDCEGNLTLNLPSTENLNIGKTHNVWDTISNSVALSSNFLLRRHPSVSML
jgi:hypothetical protein